MTAGNFNRPGCAILKYEMILFVFLISQPIPQDLKDIEKTYNSKIIIHIKISNLINCGPF